MKTILKITGVIVLLVIMAGACEDDNKCYFESSYGLNTILVGNVVSESVLTYAKYSGASTDGYVTKKTKTEEGNWIVEVEASLRAKNAFGVYSTTYYVVEAKLYCDSWELLNIKKQ